MSRPSPKVQIYTDGTSEHDLIRIDPNDKTKQKPCAFCQYKKVRTGKMFKTPRSYFKCVQCNVALCINERGCFQLFHDMINEGKIHIPQKP